MADCRHNRSNGGLENGFVQNERQQVINGKTREQLVDELTDIMDGLYSEVDPERIEELIAQIEQFGPILDEEPDVEADLQEFMSKIDFDDLDSEDKVPQKKKRKSFVRFARIAIIAAALAGCVITAHGKGFSIVDAIVEWTSEAIYYLTGYESNPDVAPEPEFMSLQEALDENNVDERLSPQRFPEGADLVEVTVKSLKGIPAFTAKYKVSDEELYISIRQVDVDLQPKVERDDETAYVHIVNEIEHQITSDVMQTKAVWRNNVWECKITGSLTTEELIAMIDSIYD